jgi:exopolysaccharide production protein ExoQ
MTPGIATLAYASLILGLFWLDRDENARPSGALWLPVVWVTLACSRTLGQWLGLPPTDQAEQVLRGNPVDRMLPICILALGLVVLVSRRQQVGRLLRANGPIIFFFLYCAVSLLWSDYPDVAFKRWTKALGDFVMVLLVLSDREPTVALKRLLVRTTYVLIPLSILFIKYYPDIGRGYGYWEGEVSYVGVTTNKNSLGMICLLFGLGSLWRFLAAYQDRKCTGRTRQLIAHGIILGMVLWLFRIVNSMTSLSCFLLASALLLLANSRVVIRRRAIVPLFMAATLAVSASVLFLGLGPGVLKTLGRNPTLTDRTEIWAVVLNMAGNPLLGTGFESFWLGPRLEKMWSTYWWHPQQAHNGYLEIFLNLGWIGVALLVVVIATGCRKVFRAWRSNALTGSLWLAYFFVGLVYNFTEAAFFRMTAPAWIFFLLAITSVPEVPAPQNLPSEQNQFQKTRPLICEPALLTLVEGSVPRPRN